MLLNNIGSTKLRQCELNSFNSANSPPPRDSSQLFALGQGFGEFVKNIYKTHLGIGKHR